MINQTGHFHHYDVGAVISEDELVKLPTGRGRRSLADENPEWFSLMNKANGKYVVLEKLPLNATTHSRIANRSVKYSKMYKNEYDFSVKSADGYCYFLGRSI